eukprot:scaffold58910_cov65-Phaeocystis_antarctica.AAC.4
MPPAMVAAPLGLGGGGGGGGRGGCGGLERAIMRTVVAASAITVGGIAASAAGGGPCCGWTRAREVRPRHLVCSLSTRHWHCVTRSQPRCGRRHRFEQCYIVRIYRAADEKAREEAAHPLNRACCLRPRQRVSIFFPDIRNSLDARGFV